LFSIKAAICNVFHLHCTSINYAFLVTTKKQLIVNWHLELQNPCLNTSVMKTLALSFKTKA
jgi:hypothetical protein